MNNLSRYHISTTILIQAKDLREIKSPAWYPTPVEVTIVQKAQGRAGHPSSVKVSTSAALYAFSEAGNRVELYAYVKPRTTAWLFSSSWEVVGRVNKAKT